MTIKRLRVKFTNSCGVHLMIKGSFHALVYELYIMNNVLKVTPSSSEYLVSFID